MTEKGKVQAASYQLLVGDDEKLIHLLVSRILKDSAVAVMRGLKRKL